MQSGINCGDDGTPIFCLGVYSLGIPPQYLTSVLFYVIKVNRNNATLLHQWPCWSGHQRFC